MGVSGGDLGLAEPEWWQTYHHTPEIEMTHEAGPPA
jgi:hypothetical protein